MCRTLLRKSTLSPTRCQELVRGWPDYVGICNVSSVGVGGVIVGKNRACTPIVFQLQWPPDITATVKSVSNPDGMTTNSDLEMAGLLLLLLVMEGVVCNLKKVNVALFSDNTPTVSWVTRLALRHSTVAARLIAALVLCLKSHQCCPLMALHIKGKANALTDIPSRSFGSVPSWHFQTNNDFQIFFNFTFPLPEQNSWTIFQLHPDVAMKVISVLRMQHFTLEAWRQLPKTATVTGPIGKDMLHLLDLTLTYRTRHSLGESKLLLDLLQELKRSLW
jgi:hypothetical protein